MKITPIIIKRYFYFDIFLQLPIIRSEPPVIPIGKIGRKNQTA